MIDGPEFSVRRDLVPKVDPPPPVVDEVLVRKIADEMGAEVERRDAWSGLDLEEIVRYVLVRSQREPAERPYTATEAEHVAALRKEMADDPDLELARAGYPPGGVSAVHRRFTRGVIEQGVKAEAELARLRAAAKEVLRAADDAGVGRDHQELAALRAALNDGTPPAGANLETLRTAQRWQKGGVFGAD